MRLRTQRRELPSFSFSSSLFGAPFGFEANDGRKNFLLVLARVFSQFFFVPAPLLGRKKSLCWHQQRDTKHKTLRRARKKTARSSFALPPLRARSLLLLLLDFFSFALSLLLARVPGKVSGNKQRERGVRSFFNSSYFFASLSLSLFCAALSPSLSLSASVLCCFGVLVS